MVGYIELSILENITNNFSESSRIGRGGHGDVYKGEYKGETIVVKLLHATAEIDDDQFMNELSNHKKVQHRNIVQLVGYCNDKRRTHYEPKGVVGPVLGKRVYKILCFEYMEGGSLKKRLSEDSLGNDWRIHYKIIKGICQGLCCVHLASILHMNLKPANIFLDKDMTAKIADFGLSRIFTGSDSHVTIKNVLGTAKYMPPELISQGVASEQADIFSLGVTIIDIMAGPQMYSNFNELGVTEFINEVLTYWTNRNMTAYLYEVEKCIKIAIECVHCERNKRPTIQDILRNLNNMETEVSSMTQLTTSPLLETTSKVHLAGQKRILPKEQRAEQDIEIIDPEERMAEQPMELLHLDRLLYLIFAFVICVIIQVVSGSIGMVVGFISTLGMVLFVTVLDFLLAQYSTVPYLRTVAVVVQDYALLITLNRKFIEIAIIPFTMLAFIVAIGSKVSKYQNGEDTLKKGRQLTAKEPIKMARVPYKILSMLRKSTIEIVMILYTMLPFIGVLGRMVSKYKSRDDTLKKGTQLSAKKMMEMARVPNLVQLFLVVWIQYQGQVEQRNIFIFSSFLLFLGSAMCALTVMIASPPVGDSPGVDLVLPAMHKACILMLMMIAHSMAAEWLGKDIIFACIPELTAVLAWFTIYCHHPELVVSINSATTSRLLVINEIVWCIVILYWAIKHHSNHSRAALVYYISAAVLAFMLFSPSKKAFMLFWDQPYLLDWIILRPWFRRVICISSSSWALSSFNAWLLEQWPAGSTPSSNGGLLTQLLRASSSMSLFLSVAMLCAQINPQVFVPTLRSVSKLFMYMLLAVVCPALLVVIGQPEYAVSVFSALQDFVIEYDNYVPNQ